MFTGIVTDVGEVVDVQRGAEKLRLTVACRYDGATVDVGASVAHAGVCLTVVEAARRGNRTAIATDVGAETLAVTTLGGWKVGDKVNLERSLKIGDELGGHMVSGHVDGAAEILERRDFDGMAHFAFRAPAALAKFIAIKGSVALDGVSLTVNAVEGDRFEVLLIPHTLEVTTLSGWKVGDRVNIEVDQMARYAARLVEAGGFAAAAPLSPLAGRGLG
ncbi:MAG: riboflavin synthase [Roseiarcus sp.]|jgi:riboflavin synthase|uniref:riboflavin synthase n=1 Tax=Roseiarcus sp. TaxID=1969460 RepID=UPI003C26C06C